jgi:hypothetical protein
MSTLTITELKAKRDALDKRIANHQPLSHIAAVNKVVAFATGRGMTQEDLFPTPIDPDVGPYAIKHEPEPYFEDTPFADFRYHDTFGYTFIADLKEQRDDIDGEIFCVLRAVHREAIERVRAFIREYKLSKEDIYPAPCEAK